MAKLASISFGGYFFFLIFGTKAPFPEVSELPDTGSSSYMNQLLSLFYLVSIVSLWGKQNEVLTFIRKEKFLLLLFLWAFASVFWSGGFTISLKRWIALFGEYIVCLAAMLHFRWSEVALRHMRVVFSIYLPVTILSVLFVHEAIQWEFPAWRGLEDTKNNLGQITTISTIVVLAIISYHSGLKNNLVHYALLACSIACVLGSRSTTSMMIGLLLIVIIVALQAGKLLKNGFVALFYACVLLLGTGAIGFIIMVFAPEIVATFLGFFGKDLTFTGRVDLWQTVIRMTESKFITGWGLGGFWIMDSPHLIPLFQEFVWIPNQSHQGYIDTYSQLGLVGLSLLILAIVSYFRGLAQLQRKHVWQWVFIGLLVLNFQESALLRARHVGNFFFVFSYIALYSDLLKEKKYL